MPAPILATYRNMTTYAGVAMVAVTEDGDTYSANPGDYWWLADTPDDPLTDELGWPLVLEVA